MIRFVVRTREGGSCYVNLWVNTANSIIIPRVHYSLKPIDIFIYLPIHLSIYIYLSIHLSIYRSIYLSIYLSIFLSISSSLTFMVYSLDNVLVLVLLSSTCTYTVLYVQSTVQYVHTEQTFSGLNFPYALFIKFYMSVTPYNSIQ